MRTTDLPIRCVCGAVRGHARVSPALGKRVVCYCDDCQAFARYLGRADEMLDAQGGTDVFQTSPARLEIEQGAEHLACVRLGPRGIYRWYTSCCRTPIANTLPTQQVPFVGLVTFSVGGGAESSPLDAVLGPVGARVFVRFASAPPPADAKTFDRPPLGLVLRLAARLVAARLRGEHRKSPFFDGRTGAPRAVPHVLDAGELRRLRPSAASPAAGTADPRETGAVRPTSAEGSSKRP